MESADEGVDRKSPMPEFFEYKIFTGDPKVSDLSNENSVSSFQFSIAGLCDR